MLFTVHVLDKPDAAAKRQAAHGEHIAHLKSAKAFGVSIVVGGPLVADDGKSSVGSLMVFEAPDRAAAEAFNRADPFHKNSIWAKVEIQRFDRKEWSRVLWLGVRYGRSTRHHWWLPIKC